MNAFVKRPLAWEYGATPGKARKISQGAPRLLLPDQSERIRQISNIYIALRYAPETAGVALDRFVKEVRAFAVRR